MFKFAEFRPDHLRLSGALAGIIFASSLSITPAHACGAEYEVQRGDSMGKIAQNCGVSFQDLMRANKLKDPSKLRIGQVLTVPGATATQTSAKSTADALSELKGEVINGRYCAQLVTEDGTRYGLVSPKIAFTSGRSVTVQGSLHKYSGCSPDKTLLVSTIMEEGVEVENAIITTKFAPLTQ